MYMYFQNGKCSFCTRCFYDFDWYEWHTVNCCLPWTVAGIVNPAGRLNLYKMHNNQTTLTVRVVSYINLYQFYEYRNFLFYFIRFFFFVWVPAWKFLEHSFFRLAQHEFRFFNDVLEKSIIMEVKNIRRNTNDGDGEGGRRNFCKNIENFEPNSRFVHLVYWKWRDEREWSVSKATKHPIFHEGQSFWQKLISAKFSQFSFCVSGFMTFF